MRTGCFVKMYPQIFSLKKFKVLTGAFLISFIFTLNVFANYFGQEKSSTYLRWNLFANRDQLQINKIGNKVIIKTLNPTVYDNLKNEIDNTTFEDPYLKGIKTLDADNSNVFTIEVSLKDESVEMFSFYREREKKYVVDFWRDGDSGSLVGKNLKVESKNKEVISSEVQKEDNVSLKMSQKEVVSRPKSTSASVLKKSNENLKKERNLSSQNTPVVDEKALEKIKEDKILSSLIVDPNKLAVKSEEEVQKENEESKKPFRDFRYGATNIWDYDPIIPSYKGPVNLKTKILEAFYPIANRDFKKNEKEAHLQLTINLYRQKKWGLMNKSIKLFQNKYGTNTEGELIEYIKINSFLRENIDSDKPELFKNAIGMMGILGEKSENYELKKAINKYLLTYYNEHGETLKVLQIAKNYYAGTRDNFDFEESIVPAEAMLNSLAKLGQIDKIRELSQEKSFKKILPASLILAYQSYGHLKASELDKGIALFEKNKASFVRPIEPVILYNSAESYFRIGRYQDAMNLYNEFIKDYSHEFVAANATLRIALCSDLLDKNYNETIELYKKAIDTALDNKINFEARVRYVAFRTVRKYKLDDADKEVRIFLDQDRFSNLVLDKNLERLLQQVRLRSLIVDAKYRDALSYLSLIPMITMSKIEARSFDGDGAEIVYGLIAEHYQKAEYAQVIKVWQTYKDRYLDKVALDPYVNFVVGSSYVKLGLYKGFDELYAAFEKLKDTPNRTFPIWISRQTNMKSSDLLAELSIIKDLKLKNYDLALKNIESFEKKIPNYNKVNYYKGIISFNQKDYKTAVNHLENFFSKQDQRVIYDPEDIADMIRAYTDSIYELGQTDKFLKVSEAILNDTTTVGTKNAYIQSVRERIAYLGVEINYGKGVKENFLVFEKKINDFKKLYPKSIYTGRMSYLLGQTMVQNQKIKEGKEIFNQLLNDKEVSDYIKDLAKSELSLINLKEKTL